MRFKNGVLMLLAGLVIIPAMANAEVVNRFNSVIIKPHEKDVISGVESFTPLKQDAAYTITVTKGNQQSTCSGLVNTQVPLLCTSGITTTFKNSWIPKNISTFTDGYNIAMVSGTQNGVSMVSVNAVCNTLLGFKTEGNEKQKVQLPRFSNASVNITVHIAQGKSYTTKLDGYTLRITHHKLGTIAPN